MGIRNNFGVDFEVYWKTYANYRYVDNKSEAIFRRYLEAIPVGRSLWFCFVYMSNQSVILHKTNFFKNLVFYLIISKLRKLPF